MSPQITFHQLPASPSLEADIRERIDDLDRFFDRIISCRVVVEAPHRHHHQGRLYRVRIDLEADAESTPVRGLGQLETDVERAWAQ